MQINGPSNINGPHQIGRTSQVRQTRPTEQTQSAGPIQDEVEISSPAASYIQQARELPDVRTERVEAIRQQILDGTYMTQEKLEGAIDGLLDELA